MTWRSTTTGAPSDLRRVASLWPHRQRNPVVIACRDDVAEFERSREELAALGAVLVTEERPGELSALLGRPSVTVCDRYLDVRLHGPDLALADVLEELRLLECSCEECPQAADELW
jgi:hypothetical protein